MTSERNSRRMADEVFLETRFPEMKPDEVQSLADAREFYFEAGGIESDVGARPEPTWYWRRAAKLLKEKFEVFKADAAIVLSGAATCIGTELRHDHHVAVAIRQVLNRWRDVNNDAQARHTPERRAPVQGTYRLPNRREPGTISWEEHCRAWAAYAAQYGSSQSAERIAERAGFSYEELVMFLGHAPETWRPA